jgi:hypothetical protein
MFAIVLSHAAPNVAEPAHKKQRTSGRYKYLAIHMDEPARQRARELANTPAFAHAQRQRKKVKPVCGTEESGSIASLSRAD